MQLDTTNSEEVRQHHVLRGQEFIQGLYIQTTSVYFSLLALCPAGVILGTHAVSTLLYLSSQPDYLYGRKKITDGQGPKKITDKAFSTFLRPNQRETGKTEASCCFSLASQQGLSPFIFASAGKAWVQG